MGCKRGEGCGYVSDHNALIMSSSHSSRRRDVFNIPKWRETEDQADDDEEFNFSQPSASGSGKGKEKERTIDQPGPVVKRRKIHNFGFLETDIQSAPATGTSSSVFAVPSSDLLKCIHHFSCDYYAARGQLFNDSRTYRKERKQRRLAKLARQQHSQDFEDASSDEEHPQPDLETEPPKKKPKEDRRRDMYKTMDGSALLAIGMLLQEHVARILVDRIPEDWEDSETTAADGGPVRGEDMEGGNIVTDSEGLAGA